MKKLLIAMMLTIPLTIAAQDNTWEKAQVNNQDQKYLVGAVPEVDGHVVFSTNINAPGKNAQQIYEMLHKELVAMTKESNQIEQSRLTLEDKDNNKLVASYQEWLVFKNKPLNLDRTRFLYQIVCNCKDGQADVQLNRIVYIYDEERDMTTYKAEEWINDKYGLNKKKTKLARVSGKFRRKTIDRVDYIFDRFTQLLQK